MRWKVSIPITSCSRFDLVEATQTAFLWKLKTVAVGIEDPTKVFDPFFTTKEIGRGVGLSVCRSIIQSHEGELWAKSAAIREQSLAHTPHWTESGHSGLIRTDDSYGNLQ
jgi:signal transduction histidine kinase